MNQDIMYRLTRNWGDRANAMACHAEMRLYDPDGLMEAYVLAIDPSDMATCSAIMVMPDRQVFDLEITWAELCGLYNQNGDSMIIDKRFVRRQASELFKELNMRYP